MSQRTKINQELLETIKNAKTTESKNHLKIYQTKFIFFGTKILIQDYLKSTRSFKRTRYFNKMI